MFASVRVTDITFALVQTPVFRLAESDRRTSVDIATARTRRVAVRGTAASG